ncbi:MAG TPA: cytochrome b/b6 domain-containing protein [Sulfuricurvum sp.]|nr:cytochrome b/b6 domain-containing protein [Sulfuricurvum sp.]
MREFSPAFRIWHWLQALVIIGLFVTVLLRESVMEKNHIGKIVQEQMVKLGTIITDEQATVIGKAVRSPMWDWHIYFGFAITALLIFRLAMIAKNGFGLDDNLKMQGVYKLYKVVYVMLLVMSISGLSLYFKLTGSMKEHVEGLHFYVGWAIFAFAVSIWLELFMPRKPIRVESFLE